MAMSESRILENTIVRLEAHGVLAPQIQPQVVVWIHFTHFNGSANTLSILQPVIHRFHLGQNPLPRVIPTIVSAVVARIHGSIHGVHETIWRLCEDLLRRFSSEDAGRMMAGSAIELLVHIGQLLRPGGSNQDMELMDDWMLENPPEQEEEMAGEVLDYYLDEGVDVGHGGFGGVPTGRSFIEGLLRWPYDRGDGVREEECMICLEEFEARAEVSKMPCSHAFHTRCIIQWLEMSNICPICRSQMPN